MIADTSWLMGSTNVGIGSDLRLNWGYDTLAWMRSGRWSSSTDYGEGSSGNPEWPKQPSWFQSNRDFINLANGLKTVGSTTQKLVGYWRETG